MIAIWLLGSAFAQEPAPAAPAPAPAAPAPAPAAPAPAAPPSADAPPPELGPAVAPEVPEAVAPEGGMVDRIAATVNDDVIALSEVYDLGSDFILKKCAAGASPSCVQDAEVEVLDALIRRTLMHQELTKLQQDVSAEEVDQAIDRTVQQYQLPDRQALRDEVEASGKKWEAYRDELKEYLRTQAFQGRVLAPRISISEDELRDLYQRTVRGTMKPVVKVTGFGMQLPPGASPEQVAEVTARAQQVVDQVNAGQLGWDDAIKTYDQGAAGMFGGQEFVQGALVEPLDSAIFQAPVGTVQPPLRMTVPNGSEVLFVIRVDDKQQKAQASPFEDVKDQLQNEVFEQKLQDAEEEWYQRARREAAVDVKIGKPAGS
jgi:hypothetical protein